MAEEVELCVEIGANNDPLEAWVEKADINQLCRACANTHENMIPIFEGDGLEHDLQAKIDKHFPINISKDDGLPHQMCFQCASTLVAWHDMYTGCIDAEKKLKNLLKKSEDGGQVKEEGFQSSIVTCDDLASGKTKSQRKIGSEMEVDDDYDDDDDDDRGDDEIETEEVVLHKLDAKKKENTVELGGKGTTIRDQSKNVVSLKNYLLASELNGSAIVLEIDEKLPLISQKTKVANSKKVFLKKRELLKLSSQICNDKFEKDSNDERHDRLLHGQLKSSNKMSDDVGRDNSFARSGTNTASSLDLESKDDAILEIKKENNGSGSNLVEVDPFEILRSYLACEVCGKCVRSKYNMRRHMKTHSSEKTYVCQLCGKSFLINQGLQRHVREVHEKIKTVPCDICHKQFTTRRNRDDHRRIHTNERPYICSVCGHTCKTSAALFTHNKTHLSELQHTCSTCGRQFRMKHNLVIHERLHTGEKPYTCDVCNRSFTTSGGFRRHLLCHSSLKEFSCNYCSMTFKQHRYLKHHIKRIHSLDT